VAASGARPAPVAAALPSICPAAASYDLADEHEDHRLPCKLGLPEAQEVGVDTVLLGRAHVVRVALADSEAGILEQLVGDDRGADVVERLRRQAPRRLYCGTSLTVPRCRPVAVSTARI